MSNPPIERRWVKLGEAPMPVIPGRVGTPWPTVRGSAIYRERSAFLRVGAARDSPLTSLGVEVFQRIARLVAGGNPDGHTDILSADQLRRLLPLAMACRAHYALVRALANALNLKAPCKFGKRLQADVLAQALLCYPNVRIIQIVGPLSNASRAAMLLARLAPELVELRLMLSSGLSVASFRPLKSCMHLRRLHIVACGTLDPAIADELAAYPALHDLRVYGCGNSSDAFFARLSLIPALESLDISGAVRFSNETLIALARSPSAKTLRRLVLSPCIGVSDDAIATLLEHTCNLVELQLERAWRVSYLFVCWASEKVPNLQKLCLKRCGSYWYDENEMGILPNLRHLEVSGDSFNDAQLSIFVRGCRALQYISLEQCTGISDDGIREICALPRLKELHLTLCHSVTDGIVAVVKGAANAPLQVLDLKACNFVSEAACVELEAYCLNIIHPFQQLNYEAIHPQV